MTKHALVVTLTSIALTTCIECRSAAPSARRPQYLVTSTPITVRATLGLCVAIDAADSQGLWWWQAGRTGCTSRMTMNRPHGETDAGLAALFHPTDAIVARKAGGVEARFRLGLHGPPGSVDVVLIAEGNRLLSVATGAEVATKRVSHVDIPLLPPRAPISER